MAVDAADSALREGATLTLMRGTNTPLAALKAPAAL